MGAYHEGIATIEEAKALFEGIEKKRIMITIIFPFLIIRIILFSNCGCMVSMPCPCRVHVLSFYPLKIE